MVAHHLGGRQQQAQPREPVEGPGPPRPARLPAGHGQPAAQGQQQKGGVHKIHLPPAVVQHRLQHDDGQQGAGRQAQKQHVLHPLLVVPQAPALPHRVAHGQAQAQQPGGQVEQGRGDANPHHGVVPGQVGGGNELAEVEHHAAPAEGAHLFESRQEISERGRPEVGPQGHYQARRQHPVQSSEGGHAGPAHLAPPPAPGQQRHRGQRQQHPHDAHVDGDGAGQRVPRGPARRGPQQQPHPRVGGNGEQGHEHGVFVVVEKLGEQAGREQQPQGRQQPQPPIAKAPGGQLVHGNQPPEADQKRAQVAKQKLVAPVLVPQQALGQAHRRLKRHAVVAVVVLGQRGVVLVEVVVGRYPGRGHHSPHVLEGNHAVVAALVFVNRQAVVAVNR